MRNLRFLPLAIAASLIFAGCPSDEDDEDETLLLGGFIEQVFQVQAAKMAACTPSVSAIYMELESGSVAVAKADIEKAVLAGRLVYHADKAAQCLEALRALPCDASDAVDEATSETCGQSLEAKVAAGGECYLGDECIGGFCDEGTCPGKCVAYAKLDESCVDVDCDSDLNLYCDSASDTCKAQKAAGEVCAGGWECLDGLECNETCVAVVEPTPAKLDETCGDVDCADGLFCDRPSYADPGTCKAVLAAGAECGVDYRAAVTECGEKQACAGFSQSMTTGTAVKGKCTAWADVGGACTATPENAMGITGCKLGLACIDSKCSIPPATGPCLTDEMIDCDPRSSFCDATEQCVAKKADGAACESDSECQSRDCVSSLCDPGCHP